MENTDNQNDISMPGTLTGAVREVIGFMKTALIFRGILLVLLGILMLRIPGRFWRTATIISGAFIFVDGLFVLVAALRSSGKGKGVHILNAVMLILLGLFTSLHPLMMNVIWVTMIGFWMLFGGFHSLSFRSSTGFSAVLSGICGIFAGLFLIFMPFLGLVTLMWMLGIITLVGGFSSILLGFRLKTR